MNILDQIRQRAKSNIKVIVLPETQDERTLKAAQKITEEKIANLILIGNSKNAPKGILTIQPETSPRFEDFVNDFYERRKARGITFEQAREIVKDPLFFGNYLVKFGFAHGSVAGAVNSTANVLRAGLQVVGVAKGISVVSSYFLMSHKGSACVFSDCGVVPNPNPEQLSDIAFSASENFELVVQQVPKVAFLSFSTKGSAKHSDVDKVCEALEIFQKKHPEILSDGEFQFDTAFVPSVGERKAPESKVAGVANVFIFPDLDSGNIAYKIAQRMGGAEAIGPIVQGLAKPCFDLSRGCSVEDIVNAAAICAIS